MRPLRVLSVWVWAERFRHFPLSDKRGITMKASAHVVSSGLVLLCLLASVAPAVEVVADEPVKLIPTATPSTAVIDGEIIEGTQDRTILRSSEGEFIAYWNAELNVGACHVGVNKWIADDVELIVDECVMTAMEIGVRGNAGPFTMDVEIWAPLCGLPYVVDGTQRVFEGEGDGEPEVAHFDFPGGVPLPSETLWVALRPDTSSTGWINAEYPELGHSQDLFATWNEQEQECDYYWYGYGPHAAFNVTIWCLGDPPMGACCDMDAGEPYCAETPQIDCLGPLARWVEGASCDDFDPPCGTSACCMPDDVCENVTEQECLAIEDPDGCPAEWQRGSFCDQAGQHCILWSCRCAEGPCNIQHSDYSPGCEDPECCDEVCRRDPFCCDYWWDSVCADRAEMYCTLPPPNDYCVDAIALEQVDENPDPNVISLEESNQRATLSPSDPGFCCHPAGPGGHGLSTIWFTFDALDTSARIDTCTTTGGSGAGSDSLLEVYAVGDPSTPEAACDSLIPLACNDDAEGCWTNGTNSRVHVFGLTIGETYYIQLASKTAANDGPYRLRITFPSPGDPAGCPDSLILWLDPPDGVVDARQPHAVNNPSELQGIDAIRVLHTTGSHDGCWSLCESDTTAAPNAIAGVTRHTDCTSTIRLDRPMTPGAVTTISYNQGTDTARFTSHPGNVDGDATAAPADLLAMIDYLNGARSLPWGVYSCDLDRDGECQPPDILRLIDLMNGAGGFAPWLYTPLPVDDSPCP